MEYNNQQIYEAISPTRIKKERKKWGKIKIASLILIIGFVAFSSVHLGYWYATDWQVMKENNLLGDTCHFNVNELCLPYTINGVTYNPICL